MRTSDEVNQVSKSSRQIKKKLTSMPSIIDEILD